MLDPEFLRRLERLAIVARKTLKGVGQGERRSKRHGGSVEFSDYRRYSPGDDTRRIDWYAYARLEQMFLKLYVEEQDLALHVLLDQSASMGTGQPPKLPFARELAAALSYVALAAGDRVTLRVVRGAEAARPFGPLRGRHGLTRLLRHLSQDSAPRGQTSLDGAVRAFLSRSPARGVVLLISDLLDPAGVRGPLERLRYSGFEVHVLHVVAPDELEPQVGADLDLEDVETGRVVTVALDQRAIRAYREAFAAFQAEVQTLCRRHGIGYVLARSDVPVEELVLGALRKSELVR
ncbi:MAG: DUF58 domain-containing protein [Planctomycetota bacterium]